MRKRTPIALPGLCFRALFLWGLCSWPAGAAQLAEPVDKVHSPVFDFPASYCGQRAQQALAYLENSTAELSGQAPRISIVMDDLGYSLPLGRRAIEMPGALTLAVLPRSPHASALADFAQAQGKELMVHLPMSNLSGQALDEGALTAAMDEDAFRAVLTDNLSALPGALGVNNHMGSLLTQQSQAMGWLMEELAQRQLYFVDSRTTAASVAHGQARAMGVPSLERKVFLDHERGCEHMGRAFRHLLAVAAGEGQALAIAHPYPESLEFLEAIVPLLPAHGIELVFASALLPGRDPAHRLEPPPEPPGATQTLPFGHESTK
ncbi:divergent polysaccharide deacetylase family protein [Gilvimarinus sp. F26214L]|uniref:divergent polysaccharide deacetylase family protein n=1 Tax=Gilvimarinus sp. DZF01 TaxID=3461371 RepID=UPI0040462A46